MIGTYGNNTIRVILSENDAQVSKDNGFIDGKVIVLEDSYRKKDMKLNIITDKILGYDCEVIDSYAEQNISLTKNKLLQLLEHGQIELNYIDENKKNGKAIEFFYSERNEEARTLLTKVFPQF